jgi:hypothetical protein
MVAAMLLAALAQQGVAAPPTVPTCALVTPRGDVIGFSMWGGDNPAEINFTATPGSAWPSRTLIGSSRPPLGNGLSFTIAGPDGFLLLLGAPETGIAQRAATLFLREGRRAMPPLAYGFCEERPTPASVAAPSASPEPAESDNPAFDPALWPSEDCGLILSDGRRVRLRFTISERDQVRLQSTALWSGQPVTLPIRWSSSGERQTGTFAREGGPEGDQIMLVGPSRAAAKLIRLRRLGDASLPNLRGYGICGYRAVERRPRP